MLIKSNPFFNAPESAVVIKDESRIAGIEIGCGETDFYTRQHLQWMVFANLNEAEASGLVKVFRLGGEDGSITSDKRTYVMFPAGRRVFIHVE